MSSEWNYFLDWDEIVLQYNTVLTCNEEQVQLEVEELEEPESDSCY